LSKVTPLIALRQSEKSREKVREKSELLRRDAVKLKLRFEKILVKVPGKQVFCPEYLFKEYIFWARLIALLTARSAITLSQDNGQGGI